MRAIMQRQRAEAFHRLHSGDGMLVLVNAWDAASARLFEQAGSPAIATTSAGMAWSLGYSDGEQVSARDLVEACARICRVVTAPVTDLRRAGVRRVSLGCGPFQAALALARRIATETLIEGTYAAMTADMLSAKEANSLFSQS